MKVKEIRVYPAEKVRLSWSKIYTSDKPILLLVLPL